MNNYINTLRSWKKLILLGIGMFVLALLLRIINLTSLPVFGDEAIYIRWSQVMNAEPGLRFLPLSDGKQPLFMWVLMFLVNRFSDPLFIGRLTSVFYGMGTLIGVFVLSFYLFRSKKLTLISSLFWAISPYSVFYDRLALVDSMLTMFGVWILIFAVATARTLRLDFAMLAGFALGGALLTKSPALLFALMVPSSWILSNWPERRKGEKVGKKEFLHLIKLVFLSLVTYFISLVMYNILRLGENFHMVAIRNSDYVFPLNQIWKSPLGPLLANANLVYDWLWKLGPSVLVVFLLLAILAQIKRARISLSFDNIVKPAPEVAVIFIWGFFPIIVNCVYSKAITTRYILYSLPFLYIFSSLIFYYLYSKRFVIRKVLVFGLVVFSIQALYSNYHLLTDPGRANLPRDIRSGFLEEWTAGTGIKEVSEYIREEYNNKPDEKIVVGTEGYFGTLPDALQFYLNDVPEIIVIGVGIDLKEIPKSLEESRDAGNKTYLVINSTRLLVEKDKSGNYPGLELIAVYPKAFRPDGSRESLLFFRLK